MCEWLKVTNELPAALSAMSRSGLRISQNGFVSEDAEPVGRGLTSAHLAWDRTWRELAASGEQSPWRRPEPKVLASVPLLRRRGVRRVLDLGTGLGRHVLPLAPEGFEAYGDGSSAGQALAEVARVLRPAGLYLGTMLSKRHAEYGVGREVRPNTFVQDGSRGDRRYPHFYCDAAELLALHPDFEPLALEDRDQGDSRRAAQYHWEFLMEKAPNPV